MSATPKGSTAVMAGRRDPRDALDFFPTPPWATRALIAHVIQPASSAPLDRLSVWEPACGEGHMAEVLRAHFGRTYGSDVFDYGFGYALGDFVGGGLVGQAHCPFWPDWIVTNPPFNKAVEFVERALPLARFGVAMLARLAFAEGGDRYRRLFRDAAPTLIAQFCERVPMTKGQWDPEAQTATAYAWFVWMPGQGRPAGTRFDWIPPGRKDALSKQSDVLRWARAADAPLFGAV